MFIEGEGVSGAETRTETSSTSTDTSTRTDTGSSSDDMGLFASGEEVRSYANGRFDRIEKLEEAFLNADTYISQGKAKSLDGLTQDDLKARGREQGWYQDAPETYADLVDHLTKAGIQIDDPEGEQVTEFVSWAKENGFSQKQMEAMAAKLGDFTTANAMVYGTVDPQAEMDKLFKDPNWGADTKKKLGTIGAWARNNLPPAFTQARLVDTAEGMNLVRRWYESATNSGPMTEVQRDAAIHSAANVDAEINRLMSQEGFNNPHHARYKRLNLQVDKLIQQQLKMKK